MLNNLFLSIGIACAISGGACILPHNVNPSLNDDPSFAVYDDSNYSITFGIDELNNYTWENLFDYIQDNHSSITSDFVIDGNDFNNKAPGNNGGSFSYYFFNITSNDEFIIYIVNDSYKFYNRVYSSADHNYVDSDFDAELTWVANSTFYDDLKSVIELDIQANTNNMPTLLDILNDIVSLLTNGLIGMGNGLGGGINNFVTTLFVSNDEMSIFIGTIAIFGGIALSVGLTRRLFSWVCSLGAKN